MWSTSWLLIDGQQSLTLTKIPFGSGALQCVAKKSTFIINYQPSTYSTDPIWEPSALRKNPSTKQAFVFYHLRCGQTFDSCWPNVNHWNPDLTFSADRIKYWFVFLTFFQDGYTVSHRSLWCILEHEEWKTNDRYDFSNCFLKCFKKGAKSQTSANDGFKVEKIPKVLKNEKSSLLYVRFARRLWTV
jgi:hypothetical protein